MSSIFGNPNMISGLLDYPTISLPTNVDFRDPKQRDPCVVKRPRRFAVIKIADRIEQKRAK